MGQPQARKSRKHTNGNHPLHRTRNYGRDVDQIHEDLAEKKKTLLKNTVVDEDKPGLGIWYCVECARWFINKETLNKHKASKIHKRRIKQLSQEIYTQKDAEAAIGLTTDKGPKPEKMDLH